MDLIFLPHRRFLLTENNPKRVSEIFSSVFTLKMLFFILSTLIFCAVVFLVPLFREHLLLFFVTFLSVLGTALFPLWFYQGIEKMKYILIITVSVTFDYYGFDFCDYKK